MSYNDMTDEQAKKAAHRILNQSRSDDEARKRIGDELGYPDPAGIAIHSISDGHGHRMAMGMMYGPSGAVLSI
ncbi:MAG: hypothetical protein KAJ19_13145 [Gammaproteobacteria bacterium]|nr:hypothetical protein [Gammaproteobacteria bacterium]